MLQAKFAFVTYQILQSGCAMQAGGLASVPESPRQAAVAPAATHQQTPQPFAFVPVGADNNDSPQLHVPPPLNLESQQRMEPPPNRHVESHAVQSEYTQPEYTQPGPAQTAQGRAHQSQQQQPQLQQRPPQLLREGPPASAASQLQPTWQDQPHYQFVNQPTPQLPRQLSREQLQQQQRHLGSIPVAASVSKHPTQAQYGYSQLPQASQLVSPQGNPGQYPPIPVAVITSGAMGAPNMWGRAEGRSGSPALQPQASSIQGPLALTGWFMLH